MEPVVAHKGCVLGSLQTVVQLLWSVPDGFMIAPQCLPDSPIHCVELRGICEGILLGVHLGVYLLDDARVGVRKVIVRPDPVPCLCGIGHNDAGARPRAYLETRNTDFSATRSHILAWRADLERQKLAGATIRRKLAALGVPV